MRVIDAVKEMIADVSSIVCSDKELTLERSAVVSFPASITLIYTQLIHQFVFRRANAVI